MNAHSEKMNEGSVADIIAEMREESARADLEQNYTLDDATESMREFAGRLEAAWKREKAEWEAAA